MYNKYELQTSLQLRECYVRNIYIWLHNIFWSYISSIRIHPVIVECKFLQNLQIFTILLQIWIYNIVHTCMYVLTVLSYILLCVIISCITSVILWNQYLSARTHGIPRTLSIWSALIRAYSWECSSSFNNNLFSCLLYVSWAE